MSGLYRIHPQIALRVVYSSSFNPLSALSLCTEYIDIIRLSFYKYMVFVSPILQCQLHNDTKEIFGICLQKKKIIIKNLKKKKKKESQLF